MVDTDKDWEAIAQTDPYWGVLTSDQYLGSGLDEATERSFFASGERHIAHVLEVTSDRIRPGFVPKAALDYGCGVGRLVLPLAQVSERVVGVDISDSMLAKAKEHAAKAGLTNATFVKADRLESLEPVDFIHSTIVLQHISTKRGMAIVAKLLDLLAPGGCGSLQFHLRGAGGPAVRLSRRAVEESELLKKLAVKMLRRPSREALVLMHPYDLTAILQLLAGNGITDAYIETVAAPSGYTDATVYFTKPV